MHFGTEIEGLEKSTHSLLESLVAESLARRGDMGMRGGDKASLSPVVRVIRYEFGGPNSVKEGETVTIC